MLWKHILLTSLRKILCLVLIRVDMQVKTISRGHFQHMSLFGRRTLGRCRSEAVRNTVEVIDVEKGKRDIIIIIDDLENTLEEDSSFREQGSNSHIPGVIHINDEGEVEGMPETACYTSTSNICQRPRGANHSCGKGNDSASADSRKQPKDGPSGNKNDLDISFDRCTLESDSAESSFESDSTDCEIIEDVSGNLREHWERAYAFRRKRMHSDQLGPEDQVGTPPSTADSAFKSHQNTKNAYAESHLDFTDKNFPNNLEEVDVECVPSSSRNDKNSFSNKSSCNEFSEDPLPGTGGKNPTTNSDPSLSIRNETNLQEDQKPGLGKHSSAAGTSGNNSIASSDIPTSIRNETTLQEDQRLGLKKHSSASRTSCSYSNADFHANGCDIGDDACNHVEEAVQVPLGTTSAFRCQSNFQYAEKSSPAKRSHARDPNISLDESVYFSFEKEDSAREEQLYHPSSLQQCAVGSSAQIEEMPVADHIYQRRNESPDEMKAKTGARYPSNKEEVVNGELTYGRSGDETNKTSSFRDTECCDISHTQSDSMGQFDDQEKASGEKKASNFQNIYASDREKLKESDDYKRAQEEEWASRQRILQIQSEEAQRLRKKRKTENLRLLDMERRQKQRLIEVRESQKKDEEMINMKEIIRDEVRKQLDKMEKRYCDMASLLRALGVPVKGGPFPLSSEVNVAYKQALLRFHPDRASRTDIRQQVEAEEKFKMISRLKEKLLLVV